ncbi:helix-turn-helix domain-containing protein [bacterium]|nr:helix-turn-helix domain-containing protein [bacterium]
MRRNRFFTPAMLDILLDWRRWRLVSRQIPREVEWVEDRRHKRWMADHSHSHSHTEVMVVLRGCGLMGYEGRVYPYTSGTIFCFGPNETHDLEMPEWGQETEMLWIVLMGRKFVARVTQFRPDLPRGRKTMGHLVMAEDSGLMVANPVVDLLEAGARRTDVRSMQLHAGVQLLVAALISQGDESDRFPEGRVQQRIVRMVQEMMEETGGAKLTPAELARVSGYSKSHFMRLFRHWTGRTVQDYLDECRWRRVHELVYAGLRQYQIAATLGFSSPASFSRWARTQGQRRGYYVWGGTFPEDVADEG